MVDQEWEDFLEYIRRALDFNRKRFKSNSRSGGYKSPTFYFVKRVKSHPILLGLAAEPAAALVEQAFKELHPEMDETFLWEELLGENNSRGQAVDPFFDFLQAWDKCKQPGSGQLEMAYQRALERPRPDDFFGGRFSGVRYASFRTLLSTADELQQLQGEENILLPVLDLEFLMGISPQMVSDLRQRAEGPFLDMKKKHDSNRGVATEYRYIGPSTAPSLAPEKEKQEKQETQDLHEKDLLRI